MYKTMLNNVTAAKWKLLAIGLFTVLCANVAFAKQPDDPKTQDILQIKQDAEYSKKGADTCLKCHDEDSKFPVLNIFKTPHGVTADKHSPMGQLQCETCHGPAGNHTDKRISKGEKREDMITFKRGNGTPVAEKNKICSSCHDKMDKSHWAGSVHQTNDVACTDCHQVHAAKDPVQVKSSQIDVCGTCHQSQKLAGKRFSTHPLKNGEQMGCSDCHSQHGSVNQHLLVGVSTNDTCFQCHAEKRGPFAFEHEPVSENCALCHNPHGSNNKAMLVQKAPLLCQSCHSSEGHPSILRDESGLPLPNGSSSAFLLGRSCTNCHSQVHGSNHPSGYRLQR